MSDVRVYFRALRNLFGNCFDRYARLVTTLQTQNDLPGVLSELARSEAQVIRHTKKPSHRDQIPFEENVIGQVETYLQTDANTLPPEVTKCLGLGMSSYAMHAISHAVKAQSLEPPKHPLADFTLYSLAYNGYFPKILSADNSEMIIAIICKLNRTLAENNQTRIALGNTANTVELLQQARTWMKRGLTPLLASANQEMIRVAQSILGGTLGCIAAGVIRTLRPPSVFSDN